jgi:hypothetical protein
VPRILLNEEWYEPISSEALYEEEYERILVEAAPFVFPSYYLIPFKLTVYSDDAAAKADFALVHKMYREWWIVEAEMSHHSFRHHVEPQVATLSRAVYGDATAQCLAAKDERINLARMQSAIKGQQPRVLVVVNAPVSNWGDLKRYDAIVTVLEIFRSRRNQHLYRLNGEQPPEHKVVSSACAVELSIFLRVQSPGILPVEQDKQMEITFQGGLTAWKRTDIADRVYLTCVKSVSLDARARYELVLREDGSLTLTESK